MNGALRRAVFFSRAAIGVFELLARARAGGVCGAHAAEHAAAHAAKRVAQQSARYSVTRSAPLASVAISAAEIQDLQRLPCGSAGK
ncbi:hypothetical protein D3C81_2020170 [compost metagenome]